MRFLLGNKKVQIETAFSRFSLRLSSSEGDTNEAKKKESTQKDCQENNRRYRLLSWKKIEKG